jgi:hypothetical protein
MRQSLPPVGETYKYKPSLSGHFLALPVSLMPRKRVSVSSMLGFRLTVLRYLPKKNVLDPVKFSLRQIGISGYEK